ncbi:hypothetical protein D9M72_586970 [compost metagenome]
MEICRCAGVLCLRDDCLYLRAEAQAVGRRLHARRPLHHAHCCRCRGHGHGTLLLAGLLRHLLLPQPGAGEALCRVARIRRQGWRQRSGARLSRCRFRDGGAGWRCFRFHLGSGPCALRAQQGTPGNVHHAVGAVAALPAGALYVVAHLDARASRHAA